MVPVSGCMLDDLKHFFNLLCSGDIRNSYKYSILFLVDVFLWFFFTASDSITGTVDLHIQSGYVFYIDNSTSDSYKGIYRSKTSGGFTMRLISSGIGKFGIQGLAVDWIAGIISPSLLLPVLSVILSNLFF